MNTSENTGSDGTERISPDFLDYSPPPPSAAEMVASTVKPTPDKTAALLFGITISLLVGILSLLAFVSVQVSSGFQQVHEHIKKAESRVSSSMPRPELKKIGEGLERIGDKIPPPSE